MPSARSLLLLGAAAPTVMAADIASLTSAIDIFYYMFCGCIVFLMQCVRAHSNPNLATLASALRRPLSRGRARHPSQAWLRHG